MSTISSVMSRHDLEVPAHLVADAEVPIIAGKPQRQGDVFVEPRRCGKVANAVPVPPEGIAVVRGEAGGNTHLLVRDLGVAEDLVSWSPNPDERAIDMGTLTVEEGGAALLVHAEHGAQGIGPGQYTVRRLRQQAEQIQRVSD